MVEDLITGEGVPEISARFHNTIINVIFAVASQIRKETKLDKIVLSGGTFQNKYILGRLELLLKKEKFRVYTHCKIPSNDGGIALGQLVIAAKLRDLGKPTH
jgi:hydrogenase maturation protein HypF